MSSEIENRIVEMKFNHDEFTKGVAKTLADLEKLDQGLQLKDAGKGLSGLQRAANNLDLSSIAEAVDAINQRFSFMDSFVGQVFHNLEDKAVNWASSMAKSLSIDQIAGGFSEYELKMGSVQTIMAGSGASMEEVNKYLEELNAYSDKTIYSFSDMTSSIGKFTNAGVKLNDAVKAIQGISNEAARSGANAQQASAAMYNFSQALSSGAVKLIDWKSIENANMATVEFKQSLLDTAVALGTVRKEGDQYISTTTDANGHVSDAFTATSMFNDSLSSLWMTSDVLTQTLANYSTDVREMTEEEYKAWHEKMIGLHYTEEQIKKIEELGKASFDAAQDVKSYSMMMDALQEAIGSGWATTFEIIFGNLEEAKVMWTNLNNVLSNTIGAVGEVRNGILKVWKARHGRDNMLEGISNLWHAFSDLMKPIGTALDYFLPTINEAGNRLAILSMKFKNVTGRMQVSEEFAKDIADTFKMLIFPIVTIGKLVGSVFGAVLPTAIKFVAEALRAIFKITGAIARSFESLFSPVEKFTKTFSKASKAFVKFFDKDITTFPNALAQTLVNLGGTAQKFLIETFEKAKSTVVPFVQQLSKALEKFKNRIGRAFDISGLTDFVSWLSEFYGTAKNMVKDFAGKTVPNAIFNTANAFKTFGGSMVDAFKNANTFGEFFENLAEPFETLKKNLGGIFTSEEGVFAKIGEFFGYITDFGSIKEKFNELVDVPELFNKVSAALDYLNTDIYKLTGIDFKATANNIGHFFGVVIRSIDQATIEYQNAFITFGQDIYKALEDSGVIEWLDAVSYWGNILLWNVSDLFGPEGLPRFFKGISDPIHKFGSDFVEAFKKASSITDFVDRVRTAFLKLTDGIKAVFYENGYINSMAKRLEMIRNLFYQFIGVFTSGIKNWIDYDNLIAGVSNAFSKLGRTLLELLHLDGVFDSIMQLQIFSDLKGDLSRLFGVVKEFFNANIASRVTAAVDTVKQKLEGIRSYFTKNLNFKKMASDIKSSFATLRARVKYLLGEGWKPNEIFGNLKNVFSQFFRNVGKTIRENINPKVIFEDGKRQITRFIDFVKDTINNIPELVDNIKKRAKELWDQFRGTAGEAGSNALSKVKEAAERLPELFSSAKEKVGEFFSAIADSKVVKGIKDVFEPMIEWVKNSRAAQGLGILFEKIKETFLSLKGSAGEGLTAFLDKMKSFKFDGETVTAFLGKLKEMFDKFRGVSTEKFSEVQTKFSEFVDMLKEKVGPAKERMIELKDTLSGTFTDILDKFKNFDWKPVFDIVKGAAAIFVFWQIIKAIDGFTSAVTIVTTIKGMFADIGKAAKAYKWELIANAFLKAGFAIGIMAASIFVLGSMDQERLANATAAISGIVLMLAIFVAALALFKKFSGASAAAEASAKDSKKGAKALDTIKEGLTSFLNKASEAFTNAMKRIGKMTLAIGAVIAIGFAIALVVKSFKTIQKLASENNFGIAVLAMLGIAAVLGAFVFLLSKCDDISVGTALSVVAIGMAIQKIVKAFKTMTKVVGNENWGKALFAMTMIGLILAALLIATGHSKKADKNIKAFGTTCLLMAIALKLIAKPLQELTKVAGADGNKFKGVAVGLGILLGVMALAIGIFAKLGASTIEEHMKGFIAGLAGLGAVAGVIWIFADAMKRLDSLDHVWRSLGVIVVGLVSMAAALAGFGVISQIFAPGLMILTKVLTAFGITVALVGAGVALFGLGIQLAAAAFPEFGEGIVKFASEIKGHENEIVNAIGVIIAGIIKGILDGIGLLAGAIVAGLDTLIVELDKYLPSLIDHFLMLCGHILVVLCIAIKNMFKWLWENMAPELKEFFSKIGKAVGGFFVDLIDWFGEKFRLMGSHIKEFFSKWGGYLKLGWKMIVAWLAEAIANTPFLSDLLGVFGVDAKEWAEQAKAEAQEALDGLTEIEAKYESERDAIRQEYKDKRDAETREEWEQHKADEQARAEEDIARIRAKYEGEAQAASDGTHATTAAVNQALEQDAGGTEESANLFGANLGNALGEGMLDQIKTMLAGGASSDELMSMMQSSGVDMGDSSMAGIMDALQNGDTSVLSEYINLGEDSTKEFKDSQDLEGAAGDNMTAASNSVRNNTYKVSNAAGTAGRVSGNAMGSSGYGAYYSSGSYVMDGAAAGIAANTYKVEAAARAAARAANDAYNIESKIESPSKVFKESGMYQMLGAAAGIAENTRYLIDNSVYAARAAVTAFNDSLVFSADGAGYSPRITPVVDELSFRNGTIPAFFDKTARLQATLDATGFDFRDSINTFSRADVRRGNETENLFRQMNDAIHDLGNRIENMEVKLNDGTLVGRIAAPIDKSLGRIAAQKARGM